MFEMGCAKDELLLRCPPEWAGWRSDTGLNQRRLWSVNNSASSQGAERARNNRKSRSCRIRRRLLPTNPPREDWARDYAVAREDGHTIFRHWVPWAALEIAPNEFDWADYDRQLDLAAENGIKTVLAEIGQDVPEWLYHRYPHARREQYDGKQRRSEMHVSCVVGGNHSMCLDNPEIADAMSRFLRALARRYKDHPGLYAYDVWNECTYYRPGAGLLLQRDAEKVSALAAEEIRQPRKTGTRMEAVQLHVMGRGSTASSAEALSGRHGRDRVPDRQRL